MSVVAIAPAQIAQVKAVLPTDAEISPRTSLRKPMNLTVLKKLNHSYLDSDVENIEKQ